MHKTVLYSYTNLITHNGVASLKQNYMKRTNIFHAQFQETQTNAHHTKY